MKSRLLLSLVLLTLSLSTFAAEEQKTVSVPVIDFSKVKSADEAWKQVENSQKSPTETPKSQEEAFDQLLKYFLTAQSTAEAFVKTFPADERSWRARLIVLRVALKLREYGIQDPNADEQKKLSEILDAPEAPATIKGEASFMKLLLESSTLTPDKPEGFVAFQKTVADYLEKYPDHVLAEQVKALQMRALDADPTSEGMATLKKLAAGSDPRQAEVAKAALERKEKTAQLTSKPVDLSFTASDGQPVDFANLRGKVVLLDFWASWCGPCMRAMPTVSATYQKLHDKGFEIVGISLDQDKDAMEETMKRMNMTWRQHFDGDGWDGKIVKQFGVQAIPSAWLIDKKGMIRKVGLTDDELAPEVEKLLKE
ncbi:alkyl hydroperoxide reductase/ Thiol specific antioxidant/ Mal allergen [Chthoniobacter flavus Ellin428]|uniref:Alkyl hydroperoxide reductase/ Thiol specific antioxidant/ Mal allergen n=1 Tax=Chthoniobacter flavus Ellin428 TaxID=497964 RepID=B4CV27_9BACT|nr:TlpA disulfide reductase family protein [Chthoniobacter flavus]EDY22415.1 alkyl hydroperoxide reductase/ Thiol specific antioxidant/ Mal allergen [Chthoniobacter flavus Ellin428]TCO94574.1 cytochrome oxidase Cu insertion factor (SCO1/SenC/PrrC family) [Chthoniobacter flavus]